jgi:hypothetical protein
MDFPANVSNILMTSTFQLFRYKVTAKKRPFGTSLMDKQGFFRPANAPQKPDFTWRNAGSGNAGVSRRDARAPRLYPAAD